MVQTLYITFLEGTPTVVYFNLLRVSYEVFQEPWMV